MLEMRWAVVFACVCLAVGVKKDGSDMLPRTELRTDDPDVLAAAQFALGELQDLSDSGIYTTLSLNAITGAAYQEGVYHDNTFVDVLLDSPHLKAGQPTKHSIIVMKNKEDGVLSFAIDEFPVMDDDAIEEFWIRKVEAHRALRETVFERLEAEFAKAA